MEVVSDPSVLARTAAAQLQDDLSFRRICARHRTQIYSPCDLICFDKQCTPNNSTSRKVEEKKGPDPKWYYLVITV